MEDYLQLDQVQEIITNTAEKDGSGLVEKHRLAQRIWDATPWTEEDATRKTREMLDRLVDESSREHVYAVTRPAVRPRQPGQDDTDKQFYDLIASELSGPQS